MPSGFRISTGRILLLAVLIPMAPAVAPAQSQAEVEGWYRRAQMLERIGRSQESLELYKRIWNADEKRFDALLRAANILEREGRDAETLTLLRDAVSRSPKTSQLWVEYGDFHFKKGNIRAADSTWREGDAAVDDRASLHTAITDRLAGHGDFETAHRWAAHGLSLADDSTAFLQRLFTIELNRGNWAQAARHGSHYSSGDPSAAAQLIAEIKGFGLSETALLALISEATDQAESRNTPGAHLFAGYLTLHTGKTDAAEYHVISGVLRDTLDLPVLLNAAEYVSGRGHPLIAAGIREVIVDTHGGNPAAARSAIEAARVFVDAGEDGRAARLYRWILDNGHPRYAEEANLNLADILVQHGRVDEAREHYRAVAQRPGSPESAQRVEFGLAEIALRERRFGEAETRLTRLANSGGNAAPQASLRLAELAMFRGNAVETHRRCAGLLERTPEADEANDCLALAGTIADARGDTAAWQRYGRMLMHFRFAETDSALVIAERLDGTSLAGPALLVVARNHAQSNRIEKAAQTYAIIIERHNGSKVREDALWELGELQRVRLKNDAAALSTYQRLLTEYPESVYLVLARRLIRELRQQVQGAS